MLSAFRHPSSVKFCICVNASRHLSVPWFFNPRKLSGTSQRQYVKIPKLLRTRAVGPQPHYIFFEVFVQFSVQNLLSNFARLGWLRKDSICIIWYVLATWSCKMHHFSNPYWPSPDIPWIITKTCFRKSRWVSNCDRPRHEKWISLCPLNLLCNLVPGRLQTMRSIISSLVSDSSFSFAGLLPSEPSRNMGAQGMEVLVLVSSLGVWGLQETQWRVLEP